MSFFYQDTYYTCGPACVRMAYSHFFGEDKGEPFFEKLLNTNNTTGTDYKNLERGVTDLGMEVLTGSFKDSEDDPLGKLQNMYDDGYKIIVAYSLNTQEPHYALFEGLSKGDSHVYLDDPHLGEKYGIASDKFVRKWKVDQKGFEAYHSVKWFLAMKK